MAEEAKEIFRKLVDRQGATVSQERPEQTFCRALSELLNTGRIRLEHLGPGKGGGDLSFDSGEMVGWFDSQYFYLLPDATYNAVARFVSGRGESIPVKDRTLWRHLDEAGLLLTETGGDGRIQRCPKKNIPQGKNHLGKPKEYRPRVLHLNRKALETIED